MLQVLVLFAGQYYTDDQLVNVYCFSMLYQWIASSYKALQEYDPAAPSNDLSPDLDSPETDDDLEMYRSQPQRIRANSRSSWFSRSTVGGNSSSPNSNASYEVCSFLLSILHVYFLVM